MSIPSRTLAFAKRSLLGLTATVALTAAGCAVGPDFERPAAPTASYTADTPAQTAAADVAGGEAQRFVQDRDIPGQWWDMFHSPELTALIDQALKNNPSLDAAKASLRQALENYEAGEGAFLPAIKGNFSATREKVSGAAFGSPGPANIFSLGSASLDISYPLDVFGGVRRQLEALGAQADYERYQYVAAYLTLTSNVVTTAVEEASLRAQIVATQQIVDLEAHQTDVLRQQFELGGAAGVAVLAQQATLAQTRATLAPLQKQLAQTRNRLAVLAGRFPSEQPNATFELTSLKLPSDLPLTLPSKLVEQRPDILTAEAQLHAASAQIGIATANMLPQITLTGSFGSMASPVSNLFTPGTGIWSLGGSLAQTLFDSGTLLHERRAAVAAFDAAAAQYRNTVLTAFGDVANALRALQFDADALAANVAAERAAADSLNVTQQQYQIGTLNYVALLTAQQQYQQAKIALVQAQATRYADTAALFQALGGGWWNNDDAARTVKDE